MRPYHFALAAILALTFAATSPAAEKPEPAQAEQNHPKKIWTNDDMDQLRSRGLISIFVREPNVAAASPAIASSEPTAVVYKSKLEDPAWYARQSADLQAELDQREAALREQQTALANAARGITQPEVAMDRPDAGVTPEAGIENLAAQLREVQAQMDELSDLARQNGIAPGVLRG